MLGVQGSRYLYCLLKNDKLLSSIEDKIAKEFNPSKVEGLQLPIRRGAFCMALYSQDKLWYRAVVERQINETSFEVLFIDYGNTEIVQLKDMKKIDAKFIKDFPSIGSKIGLAYIQVPSMDTEIAGKKYRQLMNGLIEGKDVTALLKYKSEGVNYAILIAGDDTNPRNSFNAFLLKKGYASLSKRANLPASLTEWKDMQDEAKAAELGLWGSQDLQEDDEA